MNERLSKAAQPTLGRFLSRDPIGFAGGLNLYEYADGKPASRVDPTGLTSLYDLLNPQGAIDWYNSKADSYITDSYWSALHPGALLFRALGVGTSMTPPAAAQDFAIAWGDQNTSALWRGWTTLGFAGAVTPFAASARASTTTLGGGFLRSQGRGGFAKISQGCKTFKTWLNRGDANTFVYLGRRAGELKYVGITKNFAARAAAHAHRFAIKPIEGIPKLLRNQARAIEQYIMELNPGFENIFNSISPKREKIYQPALDWAEDFVEKNGIWVPKGH